MMSKCLLSHVLVELAKGCNNEENKWISHISMEKLINMKDKNRVTGDIKKETQHSPRPKLLHVLMQNYQNWISKISKLILSLS
jgi:hypothetical protein